MKRKIVPPFFEVGPKAYCYGDETLNLAIVAEEASKKNNVDVIFTPQNTELSAICEHTSRLFVCAQHMDAIKPGVGFGLTLPEAVAATGAHAVMLNHAERPVNISELRTIVMRAKELNLLSIVCADTVEDARAIAQYKPDIIVAEPTVLIGGGQKSSLEYVKDTIKSIKDVCPDIMVLQGAGIKDPTDVYDVIYAGAEATGTTSGVMKAQNPHEMLREMIQAVREAYDARKRLASNNL